MSSRSLRPLAAELSACWRELGSILASRRLHSSLHPELGKKLTPSKLRALEVLAQHESLRVGELADRVGVDDTTATRLVDRLEELGLAERHSEEGDRRAILVGLTARGPRARRGRVGPAAAVLRRRARPRSIPTSASSSCG